MTEAEENQPAAAAAAAAAENGAEPTEKKKRSVKVVKRVKSKKSEKSGVPDLAPPPPAEQDKENSESSSIKPAASPTTTTTTTTTTSSSSAAASAARSSNSQTRRRAQRSGSNVFSMFTQNQVAQFKEAFGFIDQDKDGVISRSDIRASFDALGRLCSDKELDEMCSEAPGPINFTMFLSVFGARIQGTDEDDVVSKAFASFDEGDGFVKEDKLRHVLTTWGEKFSPAECDVILAEAPRDSRNRIDVRRFAMLVTRGNEDDGEGEEAD